MLHYVSNHSSSVDPRQKFLLCKIASREMTFISPISADTIKCKCPSQFFDIRIKIYQVLGEIAYTYKTQCIFLPVTNLNKRKEGIENPGQKIFKSLLFYSWSYLIHIIIFYYYVYVHAHTCMLVCPVRTTSWSWILHPLFVSFRAHTWLPGLYSNRSTHWMPCWPPLHLSLCLPSWKFRQQTEKPQGNASCHPFHDRVDCFQPSGGKSRAKLSFGFCRKK